MRCTTGHGDFNMNQSTITVYSPSTGEPIGAVSVDGVEDVDRAAAAAREAQQEWASRSLDDRCAVLQNVKNELLNRTDDVCALLSKEQGKPKMEALVHDVMNLAGFIDYFASNAARILAPEPIPLHLFKHRASYLHWTPRGLIGVIGPWNFPLMLCNAPAVTALIAGNGVLIKPSEFTPLIQDLARDIFIAGGVPEDLFQVVHGHAETGTAVIDRVDMIEFTGSVATGRRVAARCGERLIPCVAELGGKAPALVLDDADLERTAAALTWGGFANCGQVCASVERVLVHRSVLPQLLDKLTPRVRALLPQSAPQGAEIQMGPINNRRQLDHVERVVADAVAKGANVILGGNRIEGAGTFFEPTLLLDATPEMDVMNVETFGPVLPFMVFDDDDAMIAEANRIDLGLAAYVFSSNAVRAQAVAERIEAGTVMINDVLATHGMPETPWGGVKASSIGHTHGDDSLRHMCQQRHVNYGRVNLLKNEPLWYPYTAKRQTWIRRLLSFLLGTGIRNRIRWLMGR
ncbi:MAG: aldehyde dehydrogenase family protein [Myxococcota bacterium]|nr:aldehyde dehydrogenase family protein [Myxococcota bacterium]